MSENNSENINEKMFDYVSFNELGLFETTIKELIKSGESSLVRKIMRMNQDLSVQINSKILNKDIKKCGYRFAMRKGKMQLIKNNYENVKNQLSDREREILANIKNKL